MIDKSRIRTTDTLFSNNSGFDTRKKINRSDKQVSKELLDKIEEGITIEELDKIDLPIFKYQTQITIHGQFGELTRERIHGYKMVFQNKNKSIGIKWNAIDIKKKRHIYKYLRKIGYSIRFTSNEYYASKIMHYTEENYETLKKEYDQIDDSLIIGGKDLQLGVIPMVGKFLILKVDISAIREENVEPFLESFGLDAKKKAELDEKQRKEEEQWEKEMKEREKKREIERKQEIQKKNEEAEKLKEEYREKYEIIDSFDEIPQEDCIMSLFNSKGDEYLIKKFNSGGKVNYQVVRFSKLNKGASKDSINKRLKNIKRSEEKIQGLFSKVDEVFVLKKFGETTPTKKQSQRKVSDFKEFKDKRKESDKPSVYIVDYSDKAIAVFGDTYPIKDQLKEIGGGRFNKFLKDPDSGDRKAGWIFSKKKRDEVEKVIEEK